jgi:phosphopentomutase
LKEGEAAGPAPGHGDFRRDEVTARLALHHLRASRPRFLFIGLGETDEYGHRREYKNYLRALREADRVIGEVAAVLEGFERQGRETLLLVTTDHGRSHDFESHGAHAPESARVWLLAAGSRFVARGYARAIAPRRLADLAPTLRFALGLPKDPSAYAGEVLDELLVSSTPSRRRTVARASPR